MGKQNVIIFLALALAGCAGTESGFMFEASSGRWYTTRMTRDGEPVRRAGPARRFEVGPGDCGSGFDCSTNRERSEMASGDDHSVGAEHWFGMSFFMPNGVPNIWPAKANIAQWKHRTHDIPAAMLLLTDRGLVIELNQLQVLQRRWIFLDLIPEASLRGRWHDLVFRFVFSEGEDGLIEAWVNGEQVVNRRGPNKMAVPTRIHMKYGIYRSFLNRYRGEGPAPRQVVYIDEVRRGTRREQVDLRLIERPREAP